MFLFLFSAFAWAFRPPTRIRLILYHIKSIGVDSLSVVLLSGVFTGMVMGLQGYYSLRKFNAESFLGSAVALGLLRELGPVLSAFMVTGRTGSAMAAEIGSMKVTEQIDALYSMAINPIQYLVSPRIIAGLISMPLLTAIFNVVGIYGAYLVGVGLARRQLRELFCRDGKQRRFPGCVERPSQIGEFRSDYHLGLLLQGIPSAADGHRRRPGHHRICGPLLRLDPGLGLLHDFDNALADD